MLLGYDDEIIKKIENMSNTETKNFCHQFLENYILGNEDIVRLLYEFYYHYSKAFQNQINVFTARFSGTLKNNASSFFFILNHFHPDKLNETLEKGPSAQ